MNIKRYLEEINAVRTGNRNSAAEMDTLLKEINVARAANMPQRKSRKSNRKVYRKNRKASRKNRKSRK